MRKSVLTLLLIANICFIHAQSITGKVMDGKRNLPGSTILIKGLGVGTTTDFSGSFDLEVPQPGQYILEISNIGFERKSLSVEVKDKNVDLEELTLKETVTDLPAFTVQSTTLTGGESGIEDVPGSAYYISPREMQKFDHTDASRALRIVPGINIQEEDGFGLRPNIGLRGTGVERSSKITLMEDGILMAPAPYAAPSAYYFPTIGRMQAVEVLKGSSQIKHGPYTTGGAINLISSQIPERTSAMLKMQGGSFGSQTIHARVGVKKGRFGVLLEGFQYGADGFKNLQNGGPTGFTKYDYMVKAKYETKPEAKFYHSIAFKAGWTEELSNETYLGLTRSDFENDAFMRYSGSQVDQMTNEHRNISLTHVIKPSDNFHLVTSAYRSDFHRNWYKLDKVENDTGYAVKIGALLENPALYSDVYNIINGHNSVNELLVKANNRTYFAQGVQTNGQLTLGGDQLVHFIDFGIRVHQDQIDRFQWVDGYQMLNGNMMMTTAGEHGTESNRISGANALSGFAQYTFSYGGFRIAPGMRYEHIELYRDDYGKNDPQRDGSDLSRRSNTVDVWIPGIAGEYSINEYLMAFAGVHKGFAPPGSKEGTLPEESINYELGTRWTDGKLRSELILFYNDYQNLLGVDLAAAGGVGSGDLFNGGQAISSGVEVLVERQFFLDRMGGIRIPVAFNYTYTDAYFKNTFESDFEGWGEVSEGDQLPYLAPHQFNAAVSIVSSRIGLHTNFKYVDRMATVAGAGDSDYFTDQVMSLDCNLQFDLNKYVELSGGVRNATNQTYVAAMRPAGLRPGMPRMWTIGITARI